MTDDEKRELEIDAELNEIYNGRYKRQQQMIIGLCIAIVVVCASIVFVEWIRFKRGVANVS